MLCFLFCYVSLFIMFFVVFCSDPLPRSAFYCVLFFVAFCFLSRSVLCCVLFRYVIFFSVPFCSVSFCRVISCFLFNKMDCTYTLLYIINKGGRKNFLREDVSAVLRDEALSAFENIVIGFHEYKSTTLTPYNREKHHFFIYF